MSKTKKQKSRDLGESAHYEMITPEMAEAMLGRSAINRTRNQRRVLALARDIMCDRWQKNAETIKIDING